MISTRRTIDPDSAGANRRPLKFMIVVGSVLSFIVVLIIFPVGPGNSFDRTDGGHVAIVRNGGPFDNTTIRQVLPASSGRTNIGMFSTLHNDPTSQRFFTISSTGNGDSDVNLHRR